MPVNRLEADQVFRACNLEQLKFETTADLEPIKELSEALGQPRAVESLRFGTGMEHQGYNIFVLGQSGTGRHTMAAQVLEGQLKKLSPPDDWCYVNNFDDQSRPKKLQLPAGKGIRFTKDLAKMIKDARSALKASFESEEYQHQVQAIGEEVKERQQKAFKEISDRATKKGLALLRTPGGLAFAPLDKDGDVMSPDEFKQLPKETLQNYEKEMAGLQADSQKILEKIPQWQKEIQEKMATLNKEITEKSLTQLVAGVKAEYAEIAGIPAHLDVVKKDIMDNLPAFLTEDQQQSSLPSGEETDMDSPAIRRYKVNLVVDNSKLNAAPIVFEDNPTYANLVGKVEHISMMGALVTDFTLIKAGALHRANGGALIIDARKILTHPGAWDGLKRALQSNCIKIESLAEMYSLLSTVMLEPEPIPLKVKVIIIGEPMLYYLLQRFDPEFPQIFKVAADFDVQIERNGENQELYVRLLGNIVAKQKLLHFDKSAVGRLIEQSSRMMRDSERLNIRIRDIKDLMLEADYWARQHKHETVRAGDVQKSIDSKVFRSDRLRQRIQEEIQRGTLRIETEGSRVGQVNGLAVMMLGDFAFGKPSRISAQVYMGKGEVIDIERETKLGGPIHSKGVLILSGFLGARYGTEMPLSLSASLVFEQSYGGVEGDSASSAELYALLSAIAEVPIKQQFAVTGSVDQYGRVQAIGGVNEKIEGFFDVCRHRGLTGSQGVLIPATNVKHLMLRKDVVEAIAHQEFHVYPIENIDQGIELLTGRPAGEADEQRRYPADSVNELVLRRLRTFADNMSKFGKGEEGPGERGDRDS
ncbi:MAG: AAA family ATPase [Desulfuromonadales bacterium]|nr:AAA family ATPase [Desulfuromonadales bacterium]